MLNVQRKNLGTVSLVNLAGQVVVGETDVLRDVIQTLPKTSSVILDLANVKLIDAHGLGMMLQLRQQAQARGIRFELMNINQPVRELLRITRLDSVFQIKAGVEFFPFRVDPRRAPVAA